MDKRFLYPLKFEPILKYTIWGGEQLKLKLGKKTTAPKCGESWEISTVKNNISVVSNGFLAGNNLEELIEVYMGDLVGDKVFDRFGLEFPLLIKYIDAQDNLSIQVHPDDELAKNRHQSFGKTEMWYIMEAENDARLIIGFEQGVDQAVYLKNLKEKKLLDIMHKEIIREGDVFFIPAGRVHAIGAGTLLAEIQQTSDITYRIYDFDRKDAEGKTRELHTELALDAIDYTHLSNYKTEYTPLKNQPLEIVSCPYFTTSMLSIDKPITRDYSLLDSFVIYLCVHGNANIINNGNKTSITRGETLLIPAEIKDVTIEATELTKILEVFIK